MKAIIKHFKRWNLWRNGCLNPWPYKIYVLFRPKISPTYALTLLPEEVEEIHNSFEEGSMYGAEWLDKAMERLKDSMTTFEEET